MDKRRGHPRLVDLGVTVWSSRQYGNWLRSAKFARSKEGRRRMEGGRAMWGKKQVNSYTPRSIDHRCSIPAL